MAESPGVTLALQFIARFCAGDVAGLEPLLAPDLVFEGPLFRFDSRTDYLASLAASPPEPAGHRVRTRCAEGDSVSVFYEYLKPAGPMLIAQHFRIEDGCIAEILLVFDSAPLAR